MPMPSLLTSRAVRRGFAVCCALWAIFNLFMGHAGGYMRGVASLGIAIAFADFPRIKIHR